MTLTIYIYKKKGLEQTWTRGLSELSSNSFMHPHISQPLYAYSKSTVTYVSDFLPGRNSFPLSPFPRATLSNTRPPLRARQQDLLSSLECLLRGL